MTTVQAVAMAPQTALPPPPGWFPKAPTGAMSDDDGADEALCARYEAEQALMDGAETAQGCDWPEGPLAYGGCPW